MRILFFGAKDRGIVCLDAILTAGHEVVEVVECSRAEMPGLAELSVKYMHLVGAYRKPSDVHESSLVELWKAMKPDVLVLAGYPRLIKKPLIELPTKMCINLHAGPLPRYRGPHPMNWMLINGETQGAFSIIEVDQGVDTGPIIANSWFDIGPNDTYKDLLKLSLDVYPDMLVHTLDKIEKGTIKKVAQTPKTGFWCTRRYPKDGEINWKDMTAGQVHNLVRALVKPMPGARASCSRLHLGQFPDDIIIEGTRLIDRTYLGVPGRVAAHLSGGVVVVCKDRGILVTHCRRLVGGCIPSEEVVLATDILPLAGRNMVWT